MKKVLITGAGNGIGLAITEICLHKGMLVLMVDKDASKLTTETKRLQSQYSDQVSSYQCDISHENQVNDLAHYCQSELKHIDWLFNNAGILGPLAPVWELKSEQLHQVMTVNLYGMLHMIRAFMPMLIKQGNKAHIINMASLYALCSSSQTAAYSMSKHAVLALSEALYFDSQNLTNPINVSVAFPPSLRPPC